MATKVNNNEVNEYAEKGIRMVEEEKNKSLPKKKQLNEKQLNKKLDYSDRLIHYSRNGIPMPWEGGIFSPVEEIKDYGNSRYDVSQGDVGAVSPSDYYNYQDIRAERQGWLAKIGLGTARLFTTAGTTFVDNIVGTVYGIGQAVYEGIKTGEWGFDDVYEDEYGNLYDDDEYILDRGTLIEKATGKVIGRGRIASSYNKTLSRLVNNDVSKALHAFSNNIREKWMPIYESTEYDI